MNQLTNLKSRQRYWASGVESAMSRKAASDHDRTGGMKPAGSWTMIYGIAVIGFLILLWPASIHEPGDGARHHAGARDFTAQELGATRGQLVVQFLGESGC